MKILITGAAGFIGMHSSLKFLNSKFTVLGIDNLNNYYDRNLKLKRLKLLKKNKRFKFKKIDISSFKDLSPKESTIVIGEIGLSGELRRVQNITKRIDEAQKMGFSKAIIPNLQSKEIQNSEIKVIGVSNLKEAINIYFSN